MAAGGFAQGGYVTVTCESHPINSIENKDECFSQYGSGSSDSIFFQTMFYAEFVIRTICLKGFFVFNIN